jgi:thiol:disulfide interchange protein DsbD
MKHWPQIFCLMMFASLTLPLKAQLGGNSLGGLGGDTRPTPLPLEQAFPWFVSELAEDRFRVTWNPASGHYLYRHAFSFSLQTGGSARPQALTVQLPDGLPKTDQFFGDIEAYYDTVSADITLPRAPTAGDILIIEYQGCAEWGFCYPPQQQRVELQP